ncbi:unnamed protein product [Allacma fusca]|uniref:RRM domain-containing protein n=1 Tax=Allacma fusca TaxID=39272 RepID=A0A8J2LGL2_9HEXA|nr:unnamed protein product [Allacma fusca]
MNPLTNVRNVKKLSQRELEGHHGKTSWHDEYKDSAWIFIGGMPYDLSEGDVLTVFSQWGEIVNINMVRDKATGKFKGFGFICYENQRSTVLAVDNFNGIKILGRTIRVDHVKDYKPPKDTDKLDDITRQLYEQGCAPKVAENPNSKVVGGYKLLDEEEEEERDDGLGTHSVLKGISDSSKSRENAHVPLSVSDTSNGRKGKHHVEEKQSQKSKSDSRKDKDDSKNLKRSHKSKKSKKKHSRTKEMKKKKKKHRKHSSSESSSSSDTSDSDSDSSPDRRRKSSSKRDSSPNSKKRRRD